jgi:nucleotide-binding universal stress UspA family protein
MARPVLNPTDFSKASRAALTRASAEAKARKAELLILHVLAPVIPVVGEGYVDPSTYEQMSEAAQAGAQKQLDRVVAQAKAARVRARGMLVEGVAHEQIARIARARRCDLIVMGTHGRTGVARFFLGSVAARVAATAPCPVLTVRGR